MSIFTRAAAALGALVLLTSCFVSPGKFTSTLDIRADRNFTFTYTGEILAMNMDKLDESGSDLPLGDEPAEGEDSVYRNIAFAVPGTDARGEKQQDTPPQNDFAAAKDADAARMNAIALALSKEKGFRSARYVGANKFEVDYAISGSLTHSFIFPFNIDAKLVFPFIAIELRGDDRVRVKAPGFANSADNSKKPMGGDPASEAAAQALDGAFTLTTNAVIVSQNQEDGPTTGPVGQIIRWKVDPLTTEAPMAVLRFPAR